MSAALLLSENLQNRLPCGCQSYFTTSRTPARSELLSFFDDGEETEPRASERAARPRTASAASARPQPRPPQHRGSLPIDRHTVMVRRRVAFVAGLLLLLVIILVVNGCLKSEKQQALRDYSRSVSQLAHESEHVTGPLFTTLTGAGSKSAL